MLGVLMALLAGFMLWQMSELNDITSVLAHRNVPVSELAGEINTDTAEYRIMEFRYIIENDAQKSTALKGNLDDVRKKFDREVKEIGDLCISGNAKKCVIDIERDLKKYLDTSKEVLLLRQGGRVDEALALLTGKSHAEYEALSSSIDVLVKVSHDNANDRGLKGDSLYATSNALGIGLTLLAIVLAAASALVIARETNRQLGRDPGELLLVAQRVVDGDFNVDDGHARIGVYGSIIAMVEALKGHIEKARQESENAREQSRQAHDAMESCADCKLGFHTAFCPDRTGWQGGRACRAKACGSGYGHEPDECHRAGGGPQCRAGFCGIQRYKG